MIHSAFDPIQRRSAATSHRTPHLSVSRFLFTSARFFVCTHLHGPYDLALSRRHPEVQLSHYRIVYLFLSKPRLSTVSKLSYLVDVSFLAHLLLPSRDQEEEEEEEEE
jgi:hypothetical protein